jgi:hypothetical protein
MAALTTVSTFSQTILRLLAACSAMMDAVSGREAGRNLPERDRAIKSGNVA